MPSLLPDIPLRFFDPQQKYALINYLVLLRLPARISRQVLQQWGEQMGVEISAGDYALIDHHLRTEAVQP